MAQGPVFPVRSRAPYHGVAQVEFTYNPGFAVVQKQKNIAALHEGFRSRFPDRRVLEISSKSTQPGGVELSAFNLQKFVPELQRSAPVKCVYQGSRVFSAGGPFPDLMEGTSRQAKGDPRLKNSGALRTFRFDGQTYPASDMTAFYNYLYIRALEENPQLGDMLMVYDAFTDIEFNPAKSLACQARAAAIYVSLRRQNLLDGDLYSLLSRL